MLDFMLLMHSDVLSEPTRDAWVFEAGGTVEIRELPRD